MDLSLPTTLKRLFVTEVYAVGIAGSAAGNALIQRLDAACRRLAREDREGRDWARRNRYIGYTSYSSVRDLTQADAAFAELKSVLDQHVAQYGRQVEMSLTKPLTLQAYWVNVLDPLGGHSGHTHPGCVVSGTFYVAVPQDAGGLLFEDPRLPLMMNAPQRQAQARADRQVSASVTPAPGTLLLWESWLRHEVPVNLSQDQRISISFNYA